MNWVGLHDPVELLQNIARICSKGNLASPEVYSSWPPSGQKQMSNIFEVPFFTEKLHVQYSLSARTSRIANKNGIRAQLYVTETVTRMMGDTLLEWIQFHEYHVYVTVLKSVTYILVLTNSDKLNERIKIFQDLFNLSDELEVKFCEEKRFSMAVFWMHVYWWSLRNYVKSIKIDDRDLHIFASEKNASLAPRLWSFQLCSPLFLLLV